MKQAELFTVTVIAKQPNGTGNVLLTLARSDSGVLPVFTPGAHIDVVIPQQGKRQYSLCSASTEPQHYEICVRLDAASTGGSHWLHHGLQQGDSLTISAPRNHFPLPETSRTLLFAAGIGITPLLVMAEALAARDANFRLHLYLKTRADLPFADRLASDALRNNVIMHFSDEGDSLRRDTPDDLLYPEDSALVCCGPQGFIQYLQDRSRQYGWQAEQFYCEHFNATAAPLVDADSAFEIELANCGTRYQVSANESIAEVLEREGVAIDLSCEQGICGACVTGVLSGEPDHRDEVLSARQKAANDCIVLCCSRSRSPLLVLDL
ncbi:oxidoreductase [Erwinia endophytica]|uniref:PDR/VanB family oxidoreductase n=1 Tax=Erwinia endophytica TaxID=1563158 RepID=UPI001265E266|nr:PDR/VanB family oxidoreductase [Erwinia endophytica]KAB8312395.1 oxidoreductase [Erwinia endophytica]